MATTSSIGQAYDDSSRDPFASEAILEDVGKLITQIHHGQ